MLPAVDAALPRMTEHLVALKSEEFRAQQADFVSLSFPTIAGAGANGAIIHYKVQSAGACILVRCGCLYWHLVCGLDFKSCGVALVVVDGDECSRHRIHPLK